MGLGIFIVYSLITHLIFFVAVFDIYFTSPIIHGVKQFQQNIEPPASRLVLLVADGLRADKFFELNEENISRAPFLRSMMIDQGMWGVSHTRVPTESRPGHVAMIAGFYEDVSAIMKGWKENPVEFDSVFNKSRNTWAWGSPDILPMFAKGPECAHIHIHCYDGDFESFTGSDSSLLDDWVFDKFANFLDAAQSNKTLLKQLKEDKIVFFLHLLGIDTNGHSHKPWSKEYLDNIGKVDRGIQSLVARLDNFYGNDGRTAYVFTSDHGMTDWGSHGAGLPSETLTPLVVWGSGAEKHQEKPTSLSTQNQELTRSWKLDPSTRHDVNQADVAPLMSALLSIPIPVHSVGVLPLPFLSISDLSKAKLMFTNAKQISEQYRVKFAMVKKNSFYFVPFEKLPLSKIVEMERRITDLIARNRSREAISLSRELIGLSLDGVQYYHTYHRTPLYAVVVCGFLGGMLVSAITVLGRVAWIRNQASKSSSLGDDSKYVRMSFVFAAVFVVLTLFLLHVPFSYYLYFLLPFPIWYYIRRKRTVLRASFKYLASNPATYKIFFLYLLVGLVGVWALVASFFHRWVLTIELLVFALAVLPTSVSPSTKFLWVFVCLLSSVFPLLPVVGRDANSLLVIMGGLLGSLCSYLMGGRLGAVTFLPLTSSCLAGATLYASTQHGVVPGFFHLISWAILAASWFLPLCSSTKLRARMRTVYSCHCAVYMLISLSYDSLFCVLFCILLMVWVKLETELSGNHRVNFDELDFKHSTISLDEDRHLSFDLLRRSYVLLFFFVFAFFGVGNIASVNSFDVRIVLPFITVFKPFVMAALLAYKVLLPYFMVVCSVCCLAVVARSCLHQIFCVALIISDVMAVHFFFLVQDHGSWLEIGTSISHYVISMSMVASLIVFFGAAKFLTSHSLLRSSKSAT